MDYIIANWQSLAWSAGVLVAAVLAALLAHRIVYSALDRIAARTELTLYKSFTRYSRRPVRWIFPVMAMSAVAPGLPLPSDVRSGIVHALGLGLIAGIAWLAVSLIGVFEDVVAARYRIDSTDNLTARRIQTQAQVLRRVATVIIIVVAAAAMLMTFPTARTIGAGLFASAGAAGLVVGLAARPTLASLIAGVQIALTEPFRLDDVVVVEGEWGKIEEIQTTYVVVRIWDQRRLVLPISYFIEKPFQNWTRTSAQILGTVFLYVDYTVPVEEVRQELRRILESSALWDQNVCVLQVTNVSERALELRALMSASDSGKAWDLRCLVRERLIAFLQERFPQTLPRVRAQMLDRETEPQPV
jgi:small-conductance mechanosensitive channel